MTLTVVIPYYNEAATIGEVLARLLAVELPGVEREILCVDDGSTDGGAAVVAEFATANSGVRALALPLNLGKGAAVRYGLSQATGDWVLIQDADLELDPEDHRALLAPVLAGAAEVVYGSRFMTPVAGLRPLYRFGNRVIVGLCNLLYGARLTDVETCYKLMPRAALSRFRLRSVSFDLEPELTARLLRAGYRITEVPIHYHPRTAALGKKLNWRDGLDAVYALVKYRFLD